MDDMVKTGLTDDLSIFIKEIEKDFESETWMILERIPERWLSEEECENSICFTQYKQSDFNSWHMGRIFHPDMEFRWERNGQNFKVVYTGKPLSLTGLTPVNTEGWEKMDPEPYYLWGKPFAGSTKTPEPLYLELQIPRLLHYPILCEDKQRPTLAVIEYHDKTSGEVVHYRFSNGGNDNESL